MRHQNLEKQGRLCQCERCAVQWYDNDNDTLQRSPTSVNEGRGLPGSECRCHDPTKKNLIVLVKTCSFHAAFEGVHKATVKDRMTLSVHASPMSMRLQIQKLKTRDNTQTVAGMNSQFRISESSAFGATRRIRQGSQEGDTQARKTRKRNNTRRGCGSMTTAQQSYLIHIQIFFLRFEEFVLNSLIFVEKPVTLFLTVQRQPIASSHNGMRLRTELKEFSAAVKWLVALDRHEFVERKAYDTQIAHDNNDVRG